MESQPDPARTRRHIQHSNRIYARRQTAPRALLVQVDQSPIPIIINRLVDPPSLSFPHPYRRRLSLTAYSHPHPHPKSQPLRHSLFSHSKSTRHYHATHPQTAVHRRKTISGPIRDVVEKEGRWGFHAWWRVRIATRDQRGYLK